MEEDPRADSARQDKPADNSCDMELAVALESRNDDNERARSKEVSSPTLILSADKAVSTCGITSLEDYQRAVTYELIFNSLLEKKMLAMKRDCEERKRAKRLKRKSIGRIFFAKRLFSSMDSRKTSASLSEITEEVVHARTEPSTPQKTMKSTHKTAIKTEATLNDNENGMAAAVTAASPQAAHKRTKSRSKTKSKTATMESSQYIDSSKQQQQQQQQQQAEDSITSTLSNSSDKVQVKQSLLVQAQTHMPHDGLAVSSSSGDSKNAQTTPSNGLPPLSLERTNDTVSLASGYENGTGARLHSSTMAEDSLTSIRDSIESLSLASSRCTVSFGATEIIPEDVDGQIYERLKAAKRQRILDAKSISAQCSPILQPRHVIKTLVHAPMSPPVINKTRLDSAATITIEQPKATTASIATPVTTSCPVEVQTKFLTNQYSFTDSLFESRNISRQNTSEDSANVTVSTLLNQSDSLSLHNAPLTGRPVSISDRFKSKSTSLLVALGNGRTRPPPLPPPPFETAQHSPANSYSPTTTLAPYTLPIEQLQQLQITSNIRHSKTIPLTQRTATTTNEFTSKALTQTTSPQTLHIVTVTTASATALPQQYPIIDALDAYSYAQKQQQHAVTSTSVTMAPYAVASTSTAATIIRNGAVVNGAIVTSSSITASDTAKLHRMTSTSTGSSIGPTTTGCCNTTKSSSRDREKQRFKPQVTALGQSGSDDEYRKKKRKYKRYHRCSDPVLVYPTPSGLQHCILSMPPNDPVQYPYTEDYAFDIQLQIESDKNDDLEKIVPTDSTKHKHRKHRHHRHKKRHRHKKPKILVQDLETQEVKVIDPDDLPQRARWTIIATACLLLLMCLMLVGITLRMAPIIDDMEFEKKLEQCQSRWRSLRDKYVKEVNGAKPSSGSGAKDGSGWRYMDAMSFLQRHVAPRRTSSNMQWASDVDTSSTTQGAGEDATDEELLFSCELSPPLGQSTPNTLEPEPRQRCDKRKRHEDRFDSLCDSVADWIKKQPVQSHSSQPVSRNADFLKVLDSYLLKHSEEDQDRLKIKLLNMVCNCEK